MDGVPVGSGPRNPPTGIDRSWIDGLGVDRARLRDGIRALERTGEPRADLETRSLLRAVACLDLTSLHAVDTGKGIRSLCRRARRPLSPALVEALDGPPAPTVAAVCVFHDLVAPALEALNGSGIPVAAVSAGFPHGRSPLDARLAEIRASVEAGADEIDVVINRAHALQGRWTALHGELRRFREACGGTTMKTILATGELDTPVTIARAAHVAMAAGTDFLKTSTGREAVNATLEAGLILAEAIRDHGDRTGHVVGLKPAGGIRTPTEARRWLRLAETELGPAWLDPGLFRLGASSLLDALARRLAELAADANGGERSPGGDPG